MIGILRCRLFIVDARSDLPEPEDSYFALIILQRSRLFISADLATIDEFGWTHLRLHHDPIVAPIIHMRPCSPSSWLLIGLSFDVHSIVNRLDHAWLSISDLMQDRSEVAQEIRDSCFLPGVIDV